MFRLEVVLRGIDFGWTRVCVYVHECVCIYDVRACMRLCMYVRACVRAYACVYICMCVCVFYNLSLCTCVYTGAALA